MIRQSGFTLLELLVVIAIMGILASVTLVRSDLMQSDTEVKAAAQQIINMAKRSRQQSISVAEYRGVFPSYGLYFDTSNPNQLIIYANCLPDDNGDGDVDHNDNFAYNSAAHTICNEEMDSAPEPSDAATVEVIEIENNAFVHSIEVVVKDNPLVERDAVSINYLRPDPTVWITPEPPMSWPVVPVGYVKVTIRDRAERYEKDIVFYTTAHIETSQRRLGS